MPNNINLEKLDIVIPLLGVTRGGGIRVVAELANGLALRGHKITIITPPINTFPFPLIKHINVISRPNNPGEKGVTGRFKDFFFVYKQTAKNGRIILSNYYTTFFIGWLLCIFSNKKHVYFIQGYEAEFFNQKEKFANKVKAILAKITYSLKPHLRITISQFIKDKIGKNDIIIINDGIDPEVFKPAPVQGNNTNKKVIGTIALTEPRKGFFDFAKAVEEVSLTRDDFEVLLFTSQVDAKFDLPFKFTIRYPKNDNEVVACMQASSIFVSASHLEGFGLPGLEAMACGAALITTNSGGVVEYAQNEINSLIINVGDVSALASAIQRLLNEPNLINQLTNAGLETTAKFTWDIMCENFENELLKL